jgi:hypothetical protein
VQACQNCSLFDILLFVVVVRKEGRKEGKKKEKKRKKKKEEKGRRRKESGKVFVLLMETTETTQIHVVCDNIRASQCVINTLEFQEELRELGCLWPINLSVVFLVGTFELEMVTFLT